MASIKGIIVEIGGDTSGLQKALSKVNSSTSSLSRELKGINSLLKLDPKNTELVAQKQQILNENIKLTEESLNELQKAKSKYDEKMANGTEINTENYRFLQREIINTENKLKELKVEASNWTKAGRSIEEFGNKITNISNKIDKMGTTLTTSLTLPIAGIATAAVTVGNSFEAQMSRVQAIAGATKKELKLLTEQAVQLGAETSFGATEVAQGMENLASAGFTTKEIMEAMPGMLDLAASSGADLATSSEIAASAIRGFGLEASTATHIADVYAEAAARTNAQTEDMGEAMKYIAPVANTMGISLEETAAAIGIMSDAGIKGSQAGTSLRGALTRLTKPTDKMLGIMEDLGVEFYDNNGKMKSLTEMVDMLSKKTKGLTDEQKQNALTILFGTESLSGMLSLINRGSDELSSMTKSFKDCNGAASKMADTMLDNTSGAIEEMKGAFESAGIAIQQALAPEMKDLAKKVQSLVDDFNDLTDEEKENIIKTVALVAAIGPAVKILGTLGKGLGTVTKGVGTFSQAVGFMGKTSTEAFKNASAGTQSLTKALTFLTSPAGLATIAITATAGAVAYLRLKQTEAQKEAKEFAEEMSNQRQTLLEYNKSIDDTTNANIAQIDSVRKLKDELVNLVDENGKVKEGYESRVDFILNQLNKALGTEYELNGDIIDSYKNLQAEIDNTIEKKKAEILLNADEERYKNAIENQTQAVEDLKNAHDNLGMSIDDAKAKYEELKNKLIEREKAGDIYSFEYLNTGKEKQRIENLINAYYDAEYRVKDYTEKVKTYETNYQLFVEEKYEEIGQTITVATEDWCSKSLEEINSSIEEQGKALKIYEDIYKETGNDIALQNAQQAKKNLEELANELTQRTSTINQLSQNEIDAWKNMATESYESYSIEIAKMSPEMQTKIQEATGIIAAGTPQMQEKAEELGRKTVEEFDKSAHARQKALNTITGYLNGMTDEEKRQFLKEAGIENADIVLKELDKKELSEENGKNILKGLWNGLKNNTWRDKILGVASGLAQAVNKAFTGKDGWDEHSPSKKMKKFAEYYVQPISDVMKSKQRSIVSSAQTLADKVNSVFGNQMNTPQISDFSKIQGGLNNKIIDSTKTIFTTPQIVFNVQELDDAKLQQCFNYINRKFGSAY